MPRSWAWISGRGTPGELSLLLHKLKQVKDGHAQSIGNDLNRIKRGIGLPIFYPTEIGLIKPALLTEHRLTHAGLKPQLAYA